MNLKISFLCIPVWFLAHAPTLYGSQKISPALSKDTLVPALSSSPLHSPSFNSGIGVVRKKPGAWRCERLNKKS